MTRQERLWEYAVNLASEASSWRGLILVLTAFGMSISPQQAEAILVIGLFIAGVIGALAPDKIERKKKEGEADNDG